MRRDGRPLRILVHVPTYPPTDVGGAEISMAAVVARFRDLGHHVQVLLQGPRVQGGANDVVADPSLAATLRLYRCCDVVFTQLEARNRAMYLAGLTGRPVVHFLRMGGASPSTMPGIPDLLVFNAAWLMDTTPWPGARTVLHPPVDPEQYRVEPGDCITLVNVSKAKGAELFFELARRMPDRPFLGVRGTWGHEVIPAVVPDNVSIIGPLADMREVYGRTRLLVVPSRWESYGRVGLEGAISGIPTIASDLPGLREALGDSARYAPRDDADRWASEIAAFDDASVYDDYRSRALRRARSVVEESIEEHRRLEHLVGGIVDERRASRRKGRARASRPSPR